MADTATLEVADNLDEQIINAEKFASWVRGHRGADAHIVYDYITIATPDGGLQGIPGALNGVTVQWDHSDLNADNDDRSVVLVAGEAFHVRPGDSVKKITGGFELIKAVTE